MIVVFGSLDIDMVMPVGRFPQPGETVLCTNDYLSHAGGKGANQAVAAARAGAKVALIGKVGGDSFGADCIANLKNQGIWTSGIGVSDRPTGHAMVAVDPVGANVSIVAQGANLDTTSDQAPDEILTDRNIVLAQLGVPSAEAFDILARARKGGAVTILNASPAQNMTPAGLLNTDYLIINEVEARQIAGIFRLGTEDTRKVTLRLAEAGKLTCIITLEASGSIAARGGELYAIAALPVEAVDSTGAGDAFCGIFAACLQSGKDWLEAWRYASTGASLACTGFGAQHSTPFLEELEVHLPRLAPAKRL